nr:retrovirus-related Pol polyprotein from transposon TNT 1-94 [Tanacetum cinerariifolium]
KFKGKVDEGFLVGYFVNSKAFRVFNSRSCIVQETLHVNFLENKSNVAGTGPTWLFDIDSLTRTMNYQPVTVGNQSNPSAGFQEKFNARKTREEADQQYMLFPVWSTGSKNSQNKEGDATFDAEKPESIVNLSPSSSALSGEHDDITKKKDKGKNASQSPDIVYSDHENVGAKADFNNLESSITVSPIPTTRIHNAHPISQIIVDLPHGKREIGTKWVYRNKKDERGIVVRNKARLVAQGNTQEEGINYKEVFAPVARIEAIRLFLAYASFMGFMVYQMDVKSAFLYETIEEEVAWYETLATYLLENGFHRGKIDQTLFIKKQKRDILLVQIYVDDIIFGELTFFLGLQVKQKEDGIFINQDKYVVEILKKFGLTEGKSASTPIDTEKPLLKDHDGEDVDVHIYRSMIGSLMYLTSSRPDIMFAVCACAHFQVTPKVLHLHAVKRIFRYLKGKSHLG